MNKHKSYSYIEKDQWELYCYIVSKISEYCHNNDIKNIILIDRSARLAYIGIKEYWESNYWNIKKPNMYFLNPENLSNNLLDIEFMRKFKNTDMLKNKKQKLLVFDTCTHSWDTMNNVKRFLSNMWFSNIISWVWHDTNNNWVNLTVCKWWIMNCCYPFGEPNYLECLQKSIYSIFCEFDVDYNTWWFYSNSYKKFKWIRKEFKNLIKHYIWMDEFEKKEYLSDINDIYFKDKNLT